MRLALLVSVKSAFRNGYLIKFCVGSNTATAGWVAIPEQALSLGNDASEAVLTCAGTLLWYFLFRLPIQVVHKHDRGQRSAPVLRHCGDWSFCEGCG